ncbi:MAG: hypothetical protein Edafosvirus37_13 [Edafosvirus sp.]|uniref:Uncharacterized protein n=1 Tax=Edafosvirus sp. TaxID=2487765 RepID=A0A3G4ZZR2_9VIRU|nr:MAG: hypothetical protein Edafosvirus37_13 [Edafosvirus sp.]
MAIPALQNPEINNVLIFFGQVNFLLFMIHRVTPNIIHNWNELNIKIKYKDS